MNNRFAKIFSIFLVIALLVGTLPVRTAVYAEEDTTATETEAENDEGDNDKGSDEDKTPTPKASSENPKDKTEADKSTPTPEPDDQKESQAPTTDGDKEGDPDKTPEKEPQTTEKPEPDTDNGEGEETAISETTPAPETHKIPGKAGSTGGNPVHGYTLTLNPNYEGVAVGMYNDVTTMVLPSANRSNFSFEGWAESADGEVKYSAGQTITLTGNLTLYAIWKRFPTVTVNNGTGSGSYAKGASVTITANTPETGNKFVEWACSDRLTFTSGNATTSTATFIMPAYDVTLTAVFTDMMAHYSLSPSENTLNGSGYTDITCTLTSLKLGYVKNPYTGTSEYVEVNEIGFFMNAGTLSDGKEHSIRFRVDNSNHSLPEERKYQGDVHDSQGETFVMAIYIDPDAYANAVPGTYTGTFTYDSVWSPVRAGDGPVRGESGSIALTLVIPDKHIVTVNNGTGSGSYAEGANVTITAAMPESAGKFEKWYGVDGLTFTNGDAASSTLTFTMPAYDVTLVAKFENSAFYILSPSKYTLNGSGYTDITSTLTSLKFGYVKSEYGEESEYVRADAIGFYMNAGTLSNGKENSIPFLVDDPWHTGPENRKYQGNGYVSQGETFVMAIYIDPDAYANAVPGTYKGTFTYDSAWHTDDRDVPGASGSIELTLVVPEHVKHTVTVNNGTGSGSYAEGANVTITANAPEAGKQFKEWTGTDGLTFRNGNATSPTATFTMPDKNVEVTAVYIDTEYVEHTIKVNNGSADPAKATVGTVVKLTADAAPSGKVFDKWIVNPGTVSLSNASSSKTTFTMPAGNVEVTATYKDVPAGSFVIKVNNCNGNTTSLISAPGLVVNVKASDALAGTEFEKWEVVSGTVIFANASSAATIFVMPAENVEITARYKSSLSVKGKTATVKYSKVKKKNQTLAVSKVLTFVDKGQGKLTYAKVSGNSKILINKTTGAITVKKKLKKKTYTVKVKVMASGDNSCNPSGWKTVTFKIKVK